MVTLERDDPDPRPALLQDSNCPSCGIPLRLLETLWNLRTSKRVRILECSYCQRLIWKE